MQPKTETIQEAATRLKVSDETARRWFHSGILRGFRVGPRLLRVFSTDVDALVNGRKPGDAENAPAR